MHFQSIVYPSRVFVLAIFQVILQNEAIWLDERVRYMYLFKNEFDKVRRILKFFQYQASIRVRIQIYRYTIFSHPGSGIQFQLNAVGFTKDQTSFVAIRDGPQMVYNVELHAVSSKDILINYTAGYNVACGMHFPNPVSDQQLVVITFHLYKFDEENIMITPGNVTWLTINTTNDRKINQPFYYRYIHAYISDTNMFLRLTFTIGRMSGASYNCEFGGFAFIDNEQVPRKVMGPYCTKTGVEPLVNYLNTFVSDTNYLDLMISSYTYELVMEVAIHVSECEGVVNICDKFCGDRLKSINPVRHNYKVGVQTQGSRSGFCRVYIILEKGCIVLQGIPTDTEKNHCYVGIYAREGYLRTDFEIFIMLR